MWFMAARILPGVPPHRARLRYISHTTAGRVPADSFHFDSHGRRPKAAITARELLPGMIRYELRHREGPGDLEGALEGAGKEEEEEEEEEERRREETAASAEPAAAAVAGGCRGGLEEGGGGWGAAPELELEGGGGVAGGGGELPRRPLLLRLGKLGRRGVERHAGRQVVRRGLVGHR
jgi:hypothetical protein